MSSSDTQDLDTTAKFDRAELVRGWREYEDHKPAATPVLKVAAKTDMGQVRENNEDKFDFYEPEAPGLLAVRGSLFAVADGVGGAAAGQIASELSLKTLISSYYDHPAPDWETALREAIINANDRIFTLAQMIPERNGMGATLTCAVFIEDKVVIGQLGDSRAYLIRDGQIRQVTFDHSYVEEMVRAGHMTQQEAEHSPFRNVITRSMGAAATTEPDFFVESAQPGDIWILCSDGPHRLRHRPRIIGDRPRARPLGNLPPGHRISECPRRSRQHHAVRYSCEGRFARGGDLQRYGDRRRRAEKRGI